MWGFIVALVLIFLVYIMAIWNEGVSIKQWLATHIDSEWSDKWLVANASPKLWHYLYKKRSDVVHDASKWGVIDRKVHLVWSTFDGAQKREIYNGGPED